MSYTNSYIAPEQSPIPEAELYGPDPYDINFVFPIHVESLETERVKLVPFVPRVHAQAYWDAATRDDPTHALWRYYPTLWRTLPDFLAWLESNVRRNPANTYFAVLDKTKPSAEFGNGGSLAGVFGLFHCSDAHQTAEIAWIAVLPAFQRTHVASNAVGVLLKHCLELETASPPGLGLRRVQWSCHTRNVQSARIAERMGFKREGMFRFQYVLQEELAKDGEKPSEDRKWPEKYGRNTLVLAVCWDDWEGGIRDLVQKSIDRKA